MEQLSGDLNSIVKGNSIPLRLMAGSSSSVIQSAANHKVLKRCKTSQARRTKCKTLRKLFCLCGVASVGRRRRISTIRSFLAFANSRFPLISSGVDDGSQAKLQNTNADSQHQSTLKTGRQADRPNDQQPNRYMPILLCGSPMPTSSLRSGGYLLVLLWLLFFYQPIAQLHNFKPTNYVMAEMMLNIDMKSQKRQRHL